VKKFGVVVGVFLALWVAIALIVPLVVDVDQYRPQLIQMANQQINGKLELGKLSLSLWGQIRVDIAGLKLADPQGREVVTVKDAYFHIPFLPILSGSPVLTFEMNHPQVTVLKSKAGKLNVMSLMKETSAPAAGAPKTAPTGAENTPSASAAALPGIVTRARLGVEILSAGLTYRDESTGLSSEVKDLNLKLKDISLSHPTEIELWADLDTKMGETFQLRGPAKLIGKAQPILAEGKMDRVQLNANFTLDDVEILVPGVFEKKKGIPAHFDLAVNASPQLTQIEKFETQFFNVNVGVQGNVTPAKISLNIKSNDIQMKPWVELIPMLKGYDLGGSAQFDAAVSGSPEKLDYKAKFQVKSLTAKAPHLKSQPTFDASVSILPDQIENMALTMKAPGNDLKVQGKLVSFAAPKMSFEVTSAGMDLDQLMDFPPPASKAQKPATAEGASEKVPAKAVAPKEDYDALLAPLRDNKMLGAMVAQIGVNFKFIKANQVKLSDISCKLSFKDLSAGLDACGFKVFGGVIQSDAHFQLKPKMPTYQFGAKVEHLDIQQAVESQMELFKNTLTGKATFNMKAQGAGFNPDPALSNLKANGSMKVTDASFASIDVGKMVSEALNKSIDKLAEKVPSVKGKTLPSMPHGATKYEFISSDFSIGGGKFTAPNFVAKSMPNQGIDLKGTVTVGMKDYSLDTSWEITDTYNMTKARDLSVDQAGIRVDHILAEGNSPVHFPVHAGCTIKAPCYSYTDVPAALGKVALANVGKAASGRAKSEVKKQAEALIQKMAPPAVQNQLKDKLKSFF